MPRRRSLSDEQITRLRERLAADDAPSTRKLAEEFGVSAMTVSRYARMPKEEFAQVSPFEEIGLTGLTRYGGQVQEDYDVRWKTLSRMVPVVQEMLNYPIVAAVMHAIEMLMRGAEWSVQPGGEELLDEEAAEFIEGCIDDMSQSWSDHVSQATTFLPYGFAPFEIVYKRRLGPDKDPASKYDDGKIGWRKFAIRSQDTLTPGREWIFDDAGGIQAMNQTEKTGGQSVTIPIEKLILYRSTAAKNNPQGRSILRPVYFAYYFAKNLADIESITAERMGTGGPIVYMGKGTSTKGANSDISAAQKIVRDIRIDQQSGIVIPYPKQTADGTGMLFELLSPPSRGIIDFDAAIKRYNQQITQTVLAHFLFLGLTEQGTQ